MIAESLNDDLKTRRHSLSQYEMLISASMHCYESVAIHIPIRRSIWKRSGRLIDAASAFGLQSIRRRRKGGFFRHALAIRFSQRKPWAGMVMAEIFIVSPVSRFR